MEGPRPPRAAERESLRRLLNTVFMADGKNDMFDAFPALSNEENAGNSLVYVEGDEVISHVGMTQRWASLEGCLVRVGCVGSVATYESHRGQGFAGRLFAAAVDRARAEGVDFFMISGDRPLYLAAGATYVAHDTTAIVSRESASFLAVPGIQLSPLSAGRLEACRRAYDTKTSRFLRPLDDWQWFVRSRQAYGRPVAWETANRGGTDCAYLVHRPAQESGTVWVCEWAGDATAVAASLAPLMERQGVSRVELNLQSGDSALHGLLNTAGAALKAAHGSATYLIINFEQLMLRLRPLFEARVGLAEAARLRFSEEGDRFRFSLDNQAHEVQGRVEVARLVFGHPETIPPEGFLARLFPAPSLWYGLNYV